MIFEVQKNESAEQGVGDQEYDYEEIHGDRFVVTMQKLKKIGNFLDDLEILQY